LHEPVEKALWFIESHYARLPISHRRPAFPVFT